jgi:hypothetical protein
MLVHKCPISICIACPPGLVSESRCCGPIRELEVNRDGHDDRHGHAVEQRRRVDPLLDGVDRRLVEEGDAPQDLHVRHLALGADRALQDHDALDARLAGDVRIARPHVLELLGLLDLAPDADRLHRRRGIGQTADDTPDHTARHAAFDAASHPAVDA